MLLFFATTINYVDRSILGILKSTLMTDLKWTETDFGNVVAAFIAMGFQMLTGRILDRWPNGYLAILIVASASYLINLLIIHLLVQLAGLK